MPSDQVVLKVAGRRFQGWTGVTITQGVDQAADVFSVTGPFDPERAEVLAAFRPFGYEPVQLYLGDDLVLTGRIDSVTAKVDGRERTLTVQGRSLAGVLVDCSIDAGLERNERFVADLAIALCNPFGIKVRWDNNAPIDGARARYGQRVYEFLASIASPCNLLLHSSPAGELTITWANWFSKAAPAAALIEGKGSLLAVEAGFEGTGRYSLYKVATQFAGEPDIVGAATDEDVPIYRPLLEAVSEVATESFEAEVPGPDFTARRRRTEAVAASFRVSATVSGWRAPDGSLWGKAVRGGRIAMPNVTLYAPGAMLPREALYTAVGVTLRIDERDGKVADLRLVQPEFYAGRVPEVRPWG